MPSTAVVADTTSYLPRALIDQHDIRLVSLYVGIEGEQEKESDIDDLQGFYERLQVHPTSVTSIVRRLEAAGLVIRTPHPDDGRAVLCEITPAGRELVERATADLVAADFALRGLTEEQLQQLWSILQPLRRAAGDFT